MNDNVIQKWNKISKMSKGFYMYFKVPVRGIVPLMILLIVVNQVIWGDVKEPSFLIVSLIKIILAYLLGVVIGYFEWDFYRNLAEGYYTKASEIKNKYLFIYGFLSFGLCILISQLDYPIKSLGLTLYHIVVWPLAGLLWGLCMWLFVSNGLTKYLKREDN